jgi:Flp pilus assembly protein TadG
VRSPSSRRERQRGNTLVEFVCVVPLFFTVVFGALEGGRFVVARMMLSYAVSVGVRAATLSNATLDTTKAGCVQNVVVNAAPMLHLSTSQVEVTSGGLPATLPAAVGSTVTVSIGVTNSANKYTFQSAIPSHWSPFSTRTWSAQASMVVR